LVPALDFPPGRNAGGKASGRRSLLAELGQNLDDLLLAIHDFAQEALPVDIAVMVRP
jgi:hypothetical protein